MRPPSVEAIARAIADVDLPWPLLVDVARAAIAADDVDGARERAVSLRRSLLQPVINATGVLLHTNLGRAPLGGPTGGGYSNVELDVATGDRGDRFGPVGDLIARLTGAERAVVVNNGAAALLLVLRVMANGRSVAVSRGELVEIGGAFRVPDVMQESGATLVEVGTTNRTRLADYRNAVEQTEAPLAALLKVHQSNFVMHGFTEETSVADLATLALPVVVDLGSGLLDATCPWLDDGPPSWLAGEPAARQTLGAGATAVTFSGDKLLGGPQAGVIAGRADVVDRCARHPLMRTLRPSADVLQGLQTALLAYLRRDGKAIPLWRMATTGLDELEARAEAIARKAGLPPDAVRSTISVMGGGTLPGREIPSIGVVIPGDHRAALRAHQPPVIAIVRDGATVCDLRTVDPAGTGDGDAKLAEALAALAAH
jgi:L-seryl-tRNA(Ser) seleniumtransferase